ncbi:hypothetical protein [Aeromonas phage AS-zj]|uniref:Uncharacterized protein n=3 Tax=Caudoviricetes TaxID=2731619 RepID=A0A291LDZ2_9CAUD|nr:hypothetical protein HWB28_gp216 [Aeromonas phage AS-zj]ASU00336.1 hypothetical protein [Aeromonas phage AS-zj]ATI17255.1 hypothetical protein [Aeromonas phage AS-szw]UKM62731.1 hypothetical protein P19_0243 [Aeromonas phage P19]
MDIETTYYAFVDKGYANPQSNLFDPVSKIPNVVYTPHTKLDGTYCKFEDGSGILYVYRGGADYDFIPKVSI